MFFWSLRFLHIDLIVAYAEGGEQWTSLVLHGGFEILKDADKKS
jgi:hypothetical protein